MKKKFLFNPVFWGILLIFIGLSFLINTLLPIKIPVFSILISLVFIYFGVKLIRGNYSILKTNNLNIFGSHKLVFDTEFNEYSNVFGETLLDLSQIKLTENINLEINCLFGEFKIKLPEGVNYFIDSNTVLGKTSIFEKSTDGFGSQKYNSTNFEQNKPVLHIVSKVVLGNIIFF